MPTSYQGASGPSGPIAGSRPATRPPVSKNNAEPEPPLDIDTSAQLSQEDLILNQIWKLNVRLLTHMFNLSVNKLPDNTSILLKSPWNCKGYDPVLPTKSLPDRSAGVVYDETRGQVSNWVSDLIHRWIRYLTSKSRTPGEPPPPPPRALFGRDELVNTVVGLVDSLTPIALVGAGGIGKTSIALTILHHDRIKQRFGDDRRFIRCDQFPASYVHFLNRLSAVIGASVQNPEDLAPLRPFLSSKEMVIVLDNAESILDPQGTGAEDIYATVEELSQFGNICLCITSRISTIPPDCKIVDVPTLSIESARSAFYGIYKNGERSDVIDNILERLDFHPLSVTLLATVGHQNRWNPDRLTREWERKRTAVLRTHHNKSFAAAVELSLASPMFQELGPNAHDLLGVVAFFPQGVDENNLDWLFPTIPDRTSIFDTFCILSLTYRSDRFVTMLAPLRDHLRPKDPRSSPLLCTTKEQYFGRLSIGYGPNSPNFGETRWIMLEDVNTEHLLDVFTTVDASSGDVWDACGHFMEHLHWHKRRLVTLGPKIERLPDDHRSKPACLSGLSQLFHLAGNIVEAERLLIHALKLWRERRNDLQVAWTLVALANVNQQPDLPEEWIQQAEEALETYTQLDNTTGQAQSLKYLAHLLFVDNQLDAAEAAASRAIGLFSGQDYQFGVCQCHRTLGRIRRSKGETEEAINHFGAAFRIASSLGMHDEQSVLLSFLANLFFDQGRFDDAHAHIERAKSHAVDDPYLLGSMMWRQATFWRVQGRFKEAKSEALCAICAFEKAGASKEVEDIREFLQEINQQLRVVP